MKTTKPKDSATSRWLSYRPEIKVLDCTIRDGGLMNNHHFDDKIVKVVYDTCVAAGMDYMELGYKASRKGIKLGEHGCWKYCRGRLPPHRRRQPDRTQADGHGRCGTL